MDKIRTHVSEFERHTGGSEHLLHDHMAALHTLKTKVKSLKSRAEDAENRNRRNNLRIVGLPEGAEGPDPMAFTEHLLCSLLLQAQFSAYFVVERAHRMPAAKGPPEGPPRTFILKLLNFCDRNLVLREAKRIDTLRYEATKLMIFPDYSVDTQRLRRSVDHGKLNLRNKKINNNMLFLVNSFFFILIIM